MSEPQQTLSALSAKTTALVLIDLQRGILPFAQGPHSAEQVLGASAKLAKRFRELGAPVVLVRVGWGEKDGTVTNSERRISRQRAFLTAPGEARPDEAWKYISFMTSQATQNQYAKLSLPSRSGAGALR